MASLEETRTYQDKTIDECYAAACAALPQAGFKIWKKRDLGWLVMAKLEEGGAEIDSNCLARFGNPTPVTVTVSSSKLDEEELRPYAEKIFAALENALGV